MALKVRLNGGTSATSDASVRAAASSAASKVTSTVTCGWNRGASSSAASLSMVAASWSRVGPAAGASHVIRAVIVAQDTDVGRLDPGGHQHFLSEERRPTHYEFQYSRFTTVHRSSEGMGVRSRTGLDGSELQPELQLSDVVSISLVCSELDNSIVESGPRGRSW